MSNRTFASRRRLLTILMLLTVVLASFAVGVSANSARDVNNPGQNAQPDKITRPEGAKPGVYYIDYGTTSLNPSVYPVDGAIRFYGWNVLNPAENSYNWNELDNWIAARKAAGLGTGVMITTYDGSDAGDIRSTPNWVIKQPNAVLPATWKDSSSDPTDEPHWVNYWRRSGYNADFDYSNHSYGWNFIGNAALVTFPPAPVDTGGAGGYAAQLGGVDNASGSIWHTEERIPAMPSGISPARTVYVTARIGIETTDVNPNDHLYMELWDTNNNKLGGTQVDINNLSHANGTWQDYTFDVSAFGTERSVRVAFRTVTDGASPTTFYVDNITLMVRHLIPNYWPDTDAQRTYYKAYKKFIDAFGARYKNNSDLQFVAIGAGLYGENQPTQSDNFPNNHFDHVVDKYGNLTGADWVQYVNQLNQDHATAFSAGDGTGPARHLFTQYAPTYKSSTERAQTTDYAKSFGVGLSANFLPFDWTQAYRPQNDGFYDPVRTGWASVPIAFESYTMDLCNPVMSYWAMMGGLDKHVDYLRMDPTLIRNYDGTLTVHAPFVQWASDYMGKTTANTPKVWTVMREHGNPTLSNCRNGGLYYQKPGQGGTYPQLGNFNFFMVQRDSIPGGRTVPETNNKGLDSRYAKDPSTGTLWPEAGLGNCPTTNGYRGDLFGPNYPCFKTPYNDKLPALGGQNSTFFNIRDWNGEGKEAYTVRRTDQATENPYMFFLVDDGYVDGSRTYTANITVKYFDIGTDSFSVQYDSTSGQKTAGKVTKTGSNALKEITFTVYDGRFKNGLSGADFFLDSRNPTTSAPDGDEWVHMVEFEKLSDSPMATDTPTVTPTPSVTPSPTPNYGVVEGRIYADADENSKYDEGEALLQGGVMKLVNTETGQTAYQATSDAQGVFRFAQISPGSYYLEEQTPPLGYLSRVGNPLILPVSANQTLSYINYSFLNLGYQLDPVTPTATPTTPPVQDKRLFLPVLIK